MLEYKIEVYNISDLKSMLGCEIEVYKISDLRPNAWV